MQFGYYYILLRNFKMIKSNCCGKADFVLNSNAKHSDKTINWIIIFQ